jgi:hypothetical protein
MTASVVIGNRRGVIENSPSFYHLVNKSYGLHKTLSTRFAAQKMVWGQVFAVADIRNRGER